MHYSDMMIDQLEARGRETLARATTLINAAETQTRGLTAAEDIEHRNLLEEVDLIAERVKEMRETNSRMATADFTRVLSGEATDPSLSRGSSNVNGSLGYTRSTTYHPGYDSPSFFKDMLYARNGNADAADRLRRNNAEAMETRALGNTGGTGGSGGEFSPPAYLLEEFVKLARPGRVFADLLHKEPLPPGVSTVNLPRLLTGTSTAVQSTQNTALAQTDATTGLVSSTIVTIGGKQIMSQQLIDQSGIPFDRVILGDLAADYARQLDFQVISGTGTGGQLRGYLTATSTSTQTWTQGTPTPVGFYGQMAALQAQVNTNRYVSPNAIVMHPRRWAWLAGASDTTGRPLVLPTSGSFNAVAARGDIVAQGQVGVMLGVNVYVDPNIPTNLGAGNNQDVVLMLNTDDCWLWESDLRAEIFNQPYADSVAVLARVFNYSALIVDRYPSTLGKLTGTGLTPPTFAS